MAVKEAIPVQSNVAIKQGNGARAAVQAVQQAMEAPPARPVSPEDLVAMAEAWMQGQLERAMAQAQQEIAEPQPWWDIFVLGPFQALAPFPGPLAPHQVIKLGQSATVLTILYLNPFDIVVNPPPTNARDFLTSFGMIPYSVRVQTGNKTSWTLAAGAGLQATQNGVLTPFGQTFFINAFTFTPNAVGLHEMNITARIGIEGSVAPFGGYASWIIDPDTDILLPGLPIATRPNLRYETPVLFHVYD